MKVKITRGKFEGINACTDRRGVVAALAVDHRGNLLQAIADARGENGKATATDMQAFKTAVTKVLTPYASAILLDTEYGLEAIASRAPNAGVMLAYEKSRLRFQRTRPSTRSTARVERPAPGRDWSASHQNSIVLQSFRRGAYQRGQTSVHRTHRR